MKLIVFLSAILLHFLLLHWTESVEEEKANLTTLAQIIDFFEESCKVKNQTGGNPKSYAVAVKVPKNQCQGNFNLSNFLTQENATCVRDHISNSIKMCKSSHNCSSKPVSYLLQSGSLFTKQLERRNNSCVVIYIVYSPCQKMSDNITTALEELKNHTGIKAFVFKTVCGVDENDHKCSDLAENCTEIVKYIPLYNFVNKAV